jgi:hypothetical protein
MSDKRFETYEATKQSRPPTENCSTCEHYFTGACDGLRGYCGSYKQYRAKTLEELIKIAIGTTVMVGGVLLLAVLIGITLLY